MKKCLTKLYEWLGRPVFNSVPVKYDIGMWHQSVPNQIENNPIAFASYCQYYIDFIIKHNITRAFFLIQNPTICNWVKDQPSGKSLVVEHWLDKLPASCEAGFFLDVEPTSPWSTKHKQLFTPGDSMDLAFQLVQKLNTQATSKKVTCLSFDMESSNFPKPQQNTGYYSIPGQLWINQLWKGHMKLPTNDWGFAGADTGKTSQFSGNAVYPELYWIEEMSKACAKAGRGPQCTGSANSEYVKYKNDPLQMYAGAVGKAIDTNHAEYEKPGVWPMFSTERFVDANPKQNLCVASYYDSGDTKKNKCGLMDAFGTWSEKEFFDWLQLIKTNNPQMDKVMIYEFNFLPKDWVN